MERTNRSARARARAERVGHKKVNTVRYDAVSAMLLNEFLKEHRKVEEQERKVQEQVVTTTKLESTVAKQNEMIAKQQKQIEALSATVQKVSDQVALSKAAPQLVTNPLNSAYRSKGC